MSARDDRIERIEAITGRGGQFTWAAWMMDNLNDAEKIALARVLVADIPGVMCGKVPEAAVVTPGGNQLYRARVEGFNACRAAMLANGEKNDGR